MSGLPYSNSRSVLQEMPLQYGVNQSPSASSGMMNGIGSMLGAVNPVLGAAVSVFGNMRAQGMQNAEQRAMYEQYMSPQARMAAMKAAGINSNAAAQGISEASAPQMNAASPTSAFNGAGELLGSSVNNALAVENMKANTANIEADTESKQIDNRFQVDSYGSRLDYLKNQGLITEEQYKQAKELTEQYPEMLKTQIGEMKSRIAKNDADVRKIDEEIENLKKQRDEIDERIKNLKSGTALNYAMVGETNARAELEQAEKDKTEIDRQISEYEAEKRKLGADSNLEMKYREIEKEQGKAAADKWLESQYDIVRKVNEAVEDAQPMTGEQRRIIAHYDSKIKDAERYLKDVQERYDKAGFRGKQRLQGTLDAAHVRVEKIQKEKAEQLRRLGINESNTRRVGISGIDFSQSK